MVAEADHAVFIISAHAEQRMRMRIGRATGCGVRRRFAFRYRPTSPRRCSTVAARRGNRIECAVGGDNPLPRRFSSTLVKKTREHIRCAIRDKLIGTRAIIRRKRCAHPPSFAAIGASSIAPAA